jgi:hypothetical protein
LVLLLLLPTALQAQSATALGGVAEGNAVQAGNKRAALLVTLEDKARTLVKQRKKVKSSSQPKGGVETGYRYASREGSQQLAELNWRRAWHLL